MMDEFSQSTQYLKEAVPLMIKYQIPTTPANYALWYTYVSQTHPKLNEAIENAISKQGYCTEVLTTKLYQEHLAEQTEQNTEQIKYSLEAIAHELQSTMQDARIDTEAFQKVIEKEFSELEKFENNGMSLDEMTRLVRSLVKNSKQIGASTRQFKSQLNDAEKEIGELKERIETIQKEAYQDVMTNTLNRRAFEKDLASLISMKKTFSLILIDLDLFKGINDSFGHLFGDQVLKGFARRIEESCRNGETLYRIGGEEFAIILPERAVMIARQFAETLRRAVEKLSIMNRTTNQRINNITASFGVTEYQPGDDNQSVVHRADMQLYKAKQLGRNRVMPMSL